jgi:hypothetical protein
MIRAIVLPGVCVNVPDGGGVLLTLGRCRARQNE